VVQTDFVDLSQDIVQLTANLVDFPSESGSEGPLADAVEVALSEIEHLTVTRVGNNVVARTDRGLGERILIGGHLDTVPSAGNLPHTISGDTIFGLGSCDMKGGVAVSLKLAKQLSAPNRDITYVYYECEEVEAERNGLARLARQEPDLLKADFAVLMEPSNAVVEAGCQGTIRGVVSVPGRRAHSARSWMGKNAVHDAVEVLQRLLDYKAERVQIDGLEYREGLNAVGISGGIAGNVIPDFCEVIVNYRFAPTKSVAQAKAHVVETFANFQVTFVDEAAGALPGLDRPAAADFLAVVGQEPSPKLGWTDVAQFAEVGVPAVNFGPGDPTLAHAPDEHVRITDLFQCERILMQWLGS
jgi:succinyl-diaminopimelate desuccinylase